MTFENCRTPSEGYNVCQDPYILSEMHRVYNIANYPTQQLNVTKKFMDQIFRVSVSGAGNSTTNTATCDAVFSTWAVKYFDLFGLPVGDPVRKLEGARFHFLPTNPGKPSCSYYALDGNLGYTSLQDANGSIALRVAGSNLPIPWPALTMPICSVIASDPATMDYVAKFMNKNARMYIHKFHTSFQATPMKCQYLVSDQPNLSTFNRAFEVTFTYDHSTSNCAPVLIHTLADSITGAIVNAENAVYNTVTGFFSFITGGGAKAPTTNKVTSKYFQEFILNDIVYNANLSSYTRKSDPKFIYSFPGIFIYGQNNMPVQSGIYSNVNYVPTI